MDENASLWTNASDVVPQHEPNHFVRRFGFNAGPLLATEMFLSMVCLLITCIVYHRLQDLRNVPGKIVICMCSCLFFAYLFLIVDVSIRNRGFSKVCLSIGFMVQFTFLAMFLWTNVLSFDIWKTMKKITSSGPESEHDKSVRFIKYSVYAWSTSLFLTITAFVLDNVDIVPSEYRPKFGQKRCWLSGTTAFLIYFNLPVGVTLLANLAFYVYTVVVVHKLRNQTEMVRSQNDESRLRLNVKLLVIMGLIWFAQYLPWITGIYELYVVSGMLTCLYGVFLFVLFVCKKRIWNQLKDHLPCNCCYMFNNLGKSEIPSSQTQSSWYIKSSTETLSNSNF